MERSTGKPKKVGLGEDFWITVAGRPVPAKRTEEGVRAVIGDKPIDPAGVEHYLESKLGEHYAPVRAAMEALAASMEPSDLEYAAYALYETFRPRSRPANAGGGRPGSWTWG